MMYDKLSIFFLVLLKFQNCKSINIRAYSALIDIENGGSIYVWGPWTVKNVHVSLSKGETLKALATASGPV